MSVLSADPTKTESNRWKSEICRENRRAIRMLWFAMVPLGLVNMLAQSVISNPEMLGLRSALFLVYALILAALENYCIPQETDHATALIYLACSPIMALGVLVGTVWDPLRQANTILLLLIVVPVFVLDRPPRMAAFNGVWVAVFIGAAYRVKPEDLFRTDLLHVAEFYFASLVVYQLVTRVRMKYLRNLELVAYERDHDRKTDCLNREALASRAARYVGKPLVLAVVDLEQLQLYRDYFGPTMADAVLQAFADAVSGAFGREDTYRYTESGIACLCVGSDLTVCMDRLEKCRRTLHEFRFEDQSISMSASAGCVVGTPAADTELRDMLRLANIYARQARRMGRDETRSGPFDQKELAEGIYQSALLAETDEFERNRLTGLPGLSYFVSHADERLTNMVDVKRQPMIGFIKLQHLREFNNRYGYARGDTLLVDTAELLREAFRNRYVCHITGGQFCVLCYGSEAEEGLAQLREGLERVSPDVMVTSKAGFAPYTGTESAISLLDRAISAHDSIRLRKDAVLRVYDTKLDEELQFGEYIANHVDEAIESGWLRVYYQPIVRSTTGKVCNEEALCRWEDPKYGMLTPGRFIAVLEERGLTYKMDLFMVRQVLREFDQRKAQGVPIVPISINLSRRDFEERDMVEEISAMVEASGWPKGLIKIEITESAFVTNQELLVAELRRFHDRGFDIWLDDFGSEYSTLGLLQELDFDLIKIDMKFMENFTPDGRNYIIVSEIIDMARRLGIATLIEGVETKEQLRMMQVLGCEKIQGFYYNRPNPLDYIAERVRNGLGLAFEVPESAAYYEAVGRVNLNEPMAQQGDETGILNVADIVPAGVLELRSGEAFCLRGTDSFLCRLEDWGILDPEEDDTSIRAVTCAVPEWIDLARRCTETDKWLNATIRLRAGQTVMVYARRLSGVSYRGAVALVVVLMPELRL